MNEPSLLDVEATLIQILEANGMGWLVAQVQLAIADGVPFAEPEDRDFSPSRSNRSTESSRALPFGTRRYATRERVLLLIDSFSRVIRDAQAFEADVGSLFGSLQPSVLNFVPGDVPHATWTLDTEESALRSNTARTSELVTAFEALRELVNDR